MCEIDADDLDFWMMEILRIVSDENVGRDLIAVSSLMKKQGDMESELEQFHARSLSPLLSEQLQSLAEHDRASLEVSGRAASLERRYLELLSMARDRKKKLDEALGRFNFQGEADQVETWLTGKESLLVPMVLYN